MEPDIIPEEENDDQNLLERIWNKVDAGVKAIDFTDHVDYTDPLGWETLGQRWREKTIGKEWREGQMQDIWDTVPKAWRSNIIKAATTTAEGIGSYWQGARTIDKWYNPLEYAEFATTRSLELASLPFEGLAQLTSAGTGLDIELSRIVADFVPVGGIAKRSAQLARRVSRAKHLKRIDELMAAGNITEVRKYVETNLPGANIMFHTGDDLVESFLEATKKGDTAKATEIFNKMDELEQINANDLLTRLSNKIDGIDPSDAYEQQLKNFWKGENVEFPVRVLDDVPRDIRTTMAWESGLVDGVFDFERWLSKSLYGKYFRSRTTVAKMQAVYGTDVNFRTYADQIILPQFVKEWGPILDRLKIPRSSLQAHHIFAIRASAGLYDGLKFGSKEWVDVTNTLLKKYVRTGDMPGNLMPIVGATSDVGTPHYITHRYIDDLIGPTGEKFFTKEVREKMRRNPKYRIKKTEEFAEKMKTAEGIAVQAQKVWDRIWGPGQVIPEELVEDLSELPMTVNPKYRTDVELERLVKQVFSQIEEFPFPESMSRKEFIKNWLPQFEGKGFDALRRMFEVDLDLTPQEAMQTPLGYRILKYLQTNEIKVRNPIKKRFKKLNKPK